MQSRPGPVTSTITWQLPRKPYTSAGFADAQNRGIGDQRRVGRQSRLIVRDNSCKFWLPISSSPSMMNLTLSGRRPSVRR